MRTPLYALVAISLVCCHSVPPVMQAEANESGVDILPDRPSPPAIALLAANPPSQDILTPDGRALIVEFEVGGRAGYNPHPEWPAEASGVTIGIGYDLRFNSRSVIAHDWSALPAHDLARLVDAQGLSGQEAARRARALHDITIPWATAMDVFERTTVVKFDALTRHTYPGYDALRGRAQDSLLSLTFNRGASLVGDRRRELRTIASLSPKRNYDGMADQERAMVRIWPPGTAIHDGMKRRRLAEAALMVKP